MILSQSAILFFFYNPYSEPIKSLEQTRTNRHKQIPTNWLAQTDSLKPTQTDSLKPA